MNSEVATPQLNPDGVRSDNRTRWLRGPRLWGLAAFLVLGLPGGLLFVWRKRTSSPRDHAVPAAPAAASQLRLAGKTQAVNSRAILAPVLSGQQFTPLTVVKLARSGSRVHKGDILAEFDRQAQLRDYIDKQAQAEDQNGKALQAQAAEVAAKAKDQTELEEAETALSKAELEMKKIELLSRIDAEKAQEDLDEARATLTQLKQTFLLKRKAAAASIRVLEIQRDRTRETMMHSQANAGLMQVRSPIDGIVVYNTIWKGGTMGEVQEGDQVRPGVPFMQVVNPSQMEVHVQINQADLGSLQVGQRARVHLDAYPDLAFNGQLNSIDPMGKRGDFSAQVRNFSGTFSIEGNDTRLMPDLSAAVDVERISSGRTTVR